MINRTPRPLGTTYLGYMYHKEPTKANLGKLRTHIIKAHLNQQLWVPTTTPTLLSVKDEDKMASNKLKLKTFLPLKKKDPALYQKHKSKLSKTIYKKLNVYNVEISSVYDVALGLGLPVYKVQERMDSILLKQGQSWATDQGQMRLNELTRAIQIEALKLTVEIGPKTGLWAEELKAVARLQGYKPGAIMGANAALDQHLKALNQAALMASKMGTIPQTNRAALNVNIQNNNGTDPTPIQGQLMTTTMATRLLQEQGLTRVPLDLDSLALLHGIHGTELPDIQAIPQDAQGGARFDIQDFIHESPEPEAIPDKARNRQKHQDRRAQSLNIIDGEIL